MEKSKEPVSRLVRVEQVSFIEILKEMYPLSETEADAMAEKIQENGIITPLTVRQVDAENYQGINGQSRLAASFKLGLEFVPVTIIDCEESEVVVKAIEANAQRERSWVTKAKEVKYLVGHATQFLPKLQEDDPELKRAKTWVAKQFGYKNKALVYKLEEMNEKDPIHYALAQLDTGELKSFEEAYRKACGIEEPPKEKGTNKGNAHPRCPHFRDEQGNICPRYVELSGIVDNEPQHNSEAENVPDLDDENQTEGESNDNLPDESSDNISEGEAEEGANDGE